MADYYRTWGGLWHLEEGLITQSFFNNDYLGLHLLGYGNFLGLGGYGSPI